MSEGEPRPLCSRENSDGASEGASPKSDTASGISGVEKRDAAIEALLFSFTKINKKPISILSNSKIGYKMKQIKGKKLRYRSDQHSPVDSAVPPRLLCGCCGAETVGSSRTEPRISLSEGATLRKGVLSEL